jgi:hypothetical protein
VTIPSIVFLCTENELTRERRGYFKAFSRKINTICIAYEKEHCYDDLQDLLPNEIQPLLILHPDSWPRLLPQGLVESLYPTACFQIDTFEELESRAIFSMLFDYAFVFHPGFEQQFQKLGHPQTICLPHAVEADLFETIDCERIYEVGWVGRLDGKDYSFRRSCIQDLKEHFKVNDIERYYSPEEMAQVYKQAKVVVNLSRDDYLQDANLRCFEVMASGALLITPKPTELSALGFIEGIHYVSFQTKLEMHQLVEYYLEHGQEREEITQTARYLVMQKHTYDARVQTILEILQQNQGKLFAPARQWSKVKIYSTYLQYFTNNMLLDASFKELRILRSHSILEACCMLPFIFRCFLIKLRDSLS